MTTPALLRPTRVLAAAVACAALVAAGCSSGDGEAGADDGRLQVATTVAPITSIVANIGGDRVDVEGIVPEGSDSHTFEPRPAVAELLSTADVLYLNGLQLEEPTQQLAAANMADPDAIVALGDEVLPEDEWIFDFSFPEEEGAPNPHLWTDPRYALAYAEVVRDDLSARDPANADVYAENHDEFAGIVEELDEALRTAFATIPEENRKLLTYHDAFPYFAEHYGFEVIGAIELPNFEEPSARRVASLIEQLRREDVPAIFGSEVFPSSVLAQIAEETGVRAMYDLRDDDLPGEPGEPRHSWLGLMAENYTTMTAALGGDPSAIEAVDVRNAGEDGARYPQ